MLHAIATLTPHTWGPNDRDEERERVAWPVFVTRVEATPRRNCIPINPNHRPWKRSAIGRRFRRDETVFFFFLLLFASF